ncbi:melanocortin-2 receptor accessory protein 2 [Patagioenas fasciata monilis]|uniref:Melanocortin-2 receptor accessory protein 2 n=1 Tax=Patagioenas fasciata monilis TaxID=372326 RepID=A0A1V4JMB4_PATFA|nr:melanocortin-2 receptor accessory protein 2 [Patagioenas fasciata monilis]
MKSVKYLDSLAVGFGGGCCWLHTRLVPDVHKTRFAFGAPRGGTNQEIVLQIQCGTSSAFTVTQFESGILKLFISTEKFRLEGTSGGICVEVNVDYLLSVEEKTFADQLLASKDRQGNVMALSDVAVILDFKGKGIYLLRCKMSALRLISNRTSQQALSKSDYTWEYEYYEYGPVSFEGLKAHKYSIVIGFWVGLAVFVIFMFFVLTLLTKTGTPHQDNAEPSEKRFRMNSFVADFGRPLESERVFSRQIPEESRSLFHFCINEVEHLDKAKQSQKCPANQSCNLPIGSLTEKSLTLRDCEGWSLALGDIRKLLSQGKYKPQD